VDLVARLAETVQDLRTRGSRVLVAIDGPDAAGKTTLADRLVNALAEPVVRLSVDEFLRPREQRYARGQLSPEGCYRDSFDYERLLAAVDGVDAGVGVVDGVFLLRPELRDCWTLAVHLSEEETLRRAQVRDRGLFGSEADVERRYRARYLPAQALYREAAAPEGRADELIDNENPARPVVLRWMAVQRGVTSTLTVSAVTSVQVRRTAPTDAVRPGEQVAS
jgi:uridine kinase